MATPLFVQDVDRLAVPRLSEVLFDRTVRRFGSIAELPSNIEAIDAGLTFANGHSPFVSIVGPSGWGKTHLLECVANHISREFKVHVGILSAIDWLDGRGAYNPRNPLLLDNVQDAIARTRTRVQLRLALERRVRIGRPTMLALTGDRLTRQHASFLPNCREWSVQEIGEPTPSERGVVVKRMAESERLLLSKPLLDLISTRMMGNGYTIHGALIEDARARVDHACGLSSGNRRVGPVLRGQLVVGPDGANQKSRGRNRSSAPGHRRERPLLPRDDQNCPVVRIRGSPVLRSPSRQGADPCHWL